MRDNMKKEIVKNDRKWICEEKENYYEVKYYEYSKSNGIDVDYELTWQNGYNK